VIPISDEIRSRRTPWVTYILIAANVVIFLYEFMLGREVSGLLMRFGAVPARITNPAATPWAFATLFTSVFLHGGWTHLIGNMLYLWIFGDNVEDALGHVGYFVFYAAAGVLAGIAQTLSAPASTVPAIGASGAIAGVLAVYLVLYPTAPVRVLIPLGFFLRSARLPAALVLGMWFVLQLFNGFASLGVATMSTGGVAWFAHIGGFVAGLFVGAIVRPGVRQRERREYYADPWQRRRW
jgi:membrane associated rhomboid family serine protease